MKKKSAANSKNSISPYFFTEPSPRDYLWENWTPLPGLPEVAHFGYIDSKEASTLLEHRHPNSFEFVYIEKGKTSWVVNDIHYETKAGDVFHTAPNEYHGASNNIIEPCRLWNFSLRLPYISDSRKMEDNWMQQNHDDINRIRIGLYKMPRVVFLGNSPLHNFRRMAKALQRPGPHSLLDCRVAILDFLLQLLEKPSAEINPTEHLIYKIQKLTNEFAMQWDQRFSIEEMAAKVGISPAYLNRLFLEYTRMTPRTYLERMRIKEACRRLTETDAPITSIAIDLGFATSQHFATVFRRLTARTPSNWRQNNKSSFDDYWYQAFRNDTHDGFLIVKER